MKLKCRQTLMPSVDVAANVLWNILNSNMINTTFFTIILLIQWASLLMQSLRFTILQKNCYYLFIQWGVVDTDNLG